MEAASGDRARMIGLTAIFAAAVAVGLFIARPFNAASIAFDSQVAVIHFDRIVAGTRLESLLTTTPKPLLTVVFGPLHALTDDWRPIGWATIVAFAIGCAMVAELGRRIAGPVAGAFGGVAVIAAPALIFDVALALATPWALLGWAGAGLALTTGQPRYALAGLGLMVATLARLESIVVVALAGAALLSATLAASRRRWPIAAPPRRAWLVPGIGFMAIPVMGLHDALLAGDPFYWAGVATRYSGATTASVLAPLEAVQWLAGRYASNAALTILAALGFVRLVLDRRLALAIGVLALGPGVAALLVLLAARGVFVSERYAAAIDVGVAFAAGLGVAGLSSEAWLRVRERWPVAGRVVSHRPARLVGTALVAGLLTWPHGPFDAALRMTARESLAAARAVDGAVPEIETAIGAGGTARTSSPIIAVPTSLRPRLAVDLGLPLGALMGSDRVRPGSTPAFPRSGQLILHIPSAEPEAALLAGLEGEPPDPLGSFLLDRVAADPAAGWWLVRVR